MPMFNGPRIGAALWFRYAMLGLAIGALGCSRSTSSSGDLAGGMSDAASIASRVDAPADSIADALHAVGLDGFESPGRSRRPAARIDATGLSLRARLGDGWDVVLHAPVIEGVPTARSSALKAARLELDRGSMTEWYVATPRGLEQGFTFARPATTTDALHLAIDVSGKLHPRAAGDHVDLVDLRGVAMMAYGELVAKDGKGTTLPSRLGVESGRIVLDVDTHGAVYPIVVDPLAWEQFQEIFGATPTSPEFAAGVAIVGGTLLAGTAGTQPGQSADAYVFGLTSTGWVKTGELSAPGTLTTSPFGTPVALNGTTALLGTSVFDPAGSGAAYVFVQSGTAWTSQGTLLPGDIVPGEYFGSGVALDGDTAVVTASGRYYTVPTTGEVLAPGAAYVYTRSGTVWSQQQKLVSGNTTTLDAFGIDVSTGTFEGNAAISGDTIALTAWRTKNQTGAVYVFARVGTTWSQQAMLVAADAAPTSRFGFSVAIDGDTLLAGAPRLEHAYVFTRTGTAWSAGTTITPPAGSPASDFGYALTLRGSLMAIGAPFDPTGGVAYVYSGASTSWTLQQEIVPLDTAVRDIFGDHLAFADSTLVVTNTPDAPTTQLYVFDYGNADGVACTAASGCASGLCVEGVCCATSCDGVCQSCLASRKGSGSDGTCGFVALDGPDHGCAAPSCASAVTLRTLCDGAGTCGVHEQTACGFFACNAAASACNTTCATDADCSTGAACTAGVCGLRVGVGNECATADQCESGNCVEGVCCDTACVGTCTSCLAARKGGGSNGTCGFVAEGGSDSACPATICTSAGAGAGACNGAGGCAPTSPTSCGAFACNAAATACNATCAIDTDCIASAFCSAGVCSPRSPGLGAACTGNDGCLSGNCVDGVCCDGVCSGQCEACDVPGSAGTCTPFVGAPRGSRLACDALSATDCAKAQCDGTVTDHCAGFSNGPIVSCGGASCVGDTVVAAPHCDGLGACKAVSPTSCGQFTCGAGACKSTCAADSDCAKGYECQPDGTCAQSATCSTDGTASIDKDGVAIACGAYLCGATGTCSTSCTDTASCAAGFVCSGGLCADVTSSSSASSSGGCALGGVPRRSGVPCALVIAGMLLATIARARRRRLAGGLLGAAISIGCSKGASSNDAARAAPVPEGADASVARRDGGISSGVVATAFVATNDHAFETRGALRNAVARVDAKGLSLRSTSSRGWSGRLAYSAAKDVVPNVAGARVELDRGDVVEWYGPAPSGVEQGFTVMRTDDPRGQIRLALDVQGDLRAVARGGRVDLFAAQARVLGYGDLAAVDAHGTTLPSRLSVEGGRIVLSVDAASAAFPVVVDPNLWVVDDEVRGPGPEQFGFVVAMTSTFAVITSDAEGQGGPDGMFVYTPTATGWTQQTSIEHTSPLAPLSGPYSGFGLTAAISGAQILVGAPLASIPAATNSIGAIYVHQQSGTTWSEGQILTPNTTTNGTYQFGASLASTATTLVAGATDSGTGDGQALVFSRSGTTWTQAALLEPADLATTDSANFGAAVAVSGNTIVIGADDVANNTGAAYVFVGSGTAWTEQATLTASDGVAGDWFGGAVAIDGTTIVVGAAPSPVAQGTPPSAPTRGGAYVFTQSGTAWTEAQKLTEEGNGAFGGALAIAGPTLIVSDFGEASATGAAYVFGRTGTAWSEQQRLAPDDLKAGDFFGTAVAFSGTNAAVSATGSSDRTGTVYFYDFGPGNGSACTNASQCGSRLCVEGVCCDSPCDGLCQSCVAANQVPGGVDGTCGDAAKGRPDARCPASSCTSASTIVSLCDGTGGCADLATTSCTPYACNAASTACNTSCAVDGDCVPTAGCVAGVCVVRGANGGACSNDGACNSGHCVEGVCCNTACDGACLSCLASRQGSGADGTCGDVANGGADLRCPATICASSTDGTSASIGPAACNGAGACAPTGATSCNGFACDSATACKTSCAADSDCVVGGYCAGGTCIARGVKGATCTTSDECATGSCVDGVCCEQACTGQCQACDVPGHLGDCTTFVGAPHGTRPACDALAANDCGKLQCDGLHADQCDGFANGPSVTCGAASCAGDDALGIATCDGAGACRTVAPNPCVPFTCRDAACTTTCTTHADCASGYSCNPTTGACAQGAQCTNGGASSLDSTGQTTQCSPFLCATDGLCAVACADSSACANGFVCDGTSRCVAPTGGSGSSGCTFGASRRGTDGAASCAALLLAIVACRRRRASE